MIGKQILHYKILQELGRGGMGVVYKAEDAKLKREAAIKFLPHQIAASDEERERFKIEGQELKNLAKVSNLRKVLDIAAQIAAGLQAAHAKGVIHRDIKSSNIMVTESGQVHPVGQTSYGVKIMDFGLAKLVGQTLITKAGVNTILLGSIIQIGEKIRINC